MRLSGGGTGCAGEGGDEVPRFRMSLPEPKRPGRVLRDPLGRDPLGQCSSLPLLDGEAPSTVITLHS